MPDLEFLNVSPTTELDIIGRYNESGPENFEKVIASIPTMPFLVNGNGDRFKGAHFGWIFKLGNWEKIKKGIYDDSGSKEIDQAVNELMGCLKSGTYLDKRKAGTSEPLSALSEKMIEATPRFWFDLASNKNTMEARLRKIAREVIQNGS